MTMPMLDDVFEHKPVVPLDEIAAFEYLWSLPGMTVKKMSDLFRANPFRLPTELVDSEQSIVEAREKLLDITKARGITDFGLFMNGTMDFPSQLNDAKNPLEMLYYRGDWSLAEGDKLIAVVGSRKVSQEGIRRTKKLVKMLVDNGFTIVSGLAEGVDTQAHKTAIECGGRTIAVIGTPITEVYPKSNTTLHDEIVDKHLLISQVPILKYNSQDWRINRSFFPERNKTMSALTQATVIVEAGETSGTLIQARAAFYQKRKLFILASCFHNKSITWPEHFRAKGAVRVDDIKDILSNLSSCRE